MKVRQIGLVASVSVNVLTQSRQAFLIVKLQVGKCKVINKMQIENEICLFMTSRVKHVQRILGFK